jgi:hypothetical protein
LLRPNGVNCREWGQFSRRSKDKDINRLFTGKQVDGMFDRTGQQGVGKDRMEEEMVTH